MLSSYNSLLLLNQHGLEFPRWPEATQVVKIGPSMASRFFRFLELPTQANTEKCCVEMTHVGHSFNKTVGRGFPVVRSTGARCSQGATVSGLSRSVKAVRPRMNKQGKRFSCVSSWKRKRRREFPQRFWMIKKHSKHATPYLGAQRISP